jgi:hypothetical protein
VERNFSKKIWQRCASAYLCNPIRNKASQNAAYRGSSLRGGQANTPKKQERIRVLNPKKSEGKFWC